MTRRSLNMGGLLIVLLHVPAMAGATAAPVTLVLDPEGDETTAAAGRAVPVPDGAVDLIRLDWHADDRTVYADLSVRQLEGHGHTTYHVDFAFDGHPHRLEIHRWQDESGVVLDARVGLYSVPSDSIQPRALVDVEEKGDAMRAAFPLEALVDAEGAPPGPGSFLTDFTVHAFRSYASTGSAEASSRDDASGAASYVLPGFSSQSNLTLATAVPFRVSSGSDELLYWITVENAGPSQKFLLEATGVPPGWLVQVPVSEVHLDQGDRTTLPVIVYIEGPPLGSGQESFHLELTAEASRERARLALGITAPEIPQPSHDRSRLHFHERHGQGGAVIDAALAPSNQFGYLNAAPPADDPHDRGQAIYGEFEGLAYEWFLPVLPALATGLDFDTEGPAHLRLPLSFTGKAEGAELEATLTYHPREGAPVTLAAGGSSVAPFGPGETTLELDMPISRGADFLHFQPGVDVVLAIELRGVFTETPVPTRGAMAIQPGAYVDLPLLPYRDAVAEAMDAEALEFLLASPVPAMEPGTVEHIDMQLANAGDKDRMVAVSVHGREADWARVAGPATLAVPSGQKANVDLQIAVPRTAGPGSQAKILVLAHDAEDPTEMEAFALEVQVEAPVPEQARETKKTPFAVGVLLAVVVLAHWRRRP